MKRDPTFAETLWSFRWQRRLSQSKLARMAGFDHSYVSRMEAGTRIPTREAVLRLATALELERDDRIELMAAAGFLDDSVPTYILVAAANFAVAHSLASAEPAQRSPA